MSSNSPPRDGVPFCKEEEIAVIKAGNRAKSTITECSSNISRSYKLIALRALKRKRDFQETFLRIYAKLQLQHPAWPKRTGESVLYKYAEMSRNIRKDCSKFGSAWCSCHAATCVSATRAQVHCALAAVAAAHASVRNDLALQQL